MDVAGPQRFSILAPQIQLWNVIVVRNAHKTAKTDLSKIKSLSGRNKVIARCNKANRAARREKLAILKTKPCADCGNSYPHYVMDFDHIRGEKVTNLSKLVNATVSWDRVLIEVDKCDLVCSNCHRIRTWRRYQASSKGLGHMPDKRGI